MIFIDTNYFLRFILNDVPVQNKIVTELFIKASRENIRLFTDIIVIFEVYWVLKEYYSMEKVYIKNALSDICHVDVVEISEKKLLLETIKNLELFNYDFEDAYHFFYCQSQKINQIATFDKKLNNKFKLLNKIQSN